MGGYLCWESEASKWPDCLFIICPRPYAVPFLCTGTFTAIFIETGAYLHMVNVCQILAKWMSTCFHLTNWFHSGIWFGVTISILILNVYIFTKMALTFSVSIRLFHLRGTTVKMPLDLSSCLIGTMFPSSKSWCKITDDILCSSKASSEGSSVWGIG